MSVITRMRRQKAVWWAQIPGSSPDAYGNPKLSPPVEIACRWEEIVKEFIGKDGTPQISSAVVYPDRVLTIGDVLWLGTLASVPYPGQARTNPAWKEVKGFSSTPNFKATQMLYTAYC